MTPILIDCDPGIDDAVAILLALASGKLDVRAITTVSGNLPADQCSSNARKLLDLAQAGSIPVACGPLKPLVRPFPRDPFSHGDDGLGELALPASLRLEDARFAPDLILDAASEAEGALTILALGPLTNLALAVIKDPTLPQRVRRVVCIAGAFGFHSTGSTRATGDNPASEWNVYVDPEAARIVFEAGFELTAIGLDVATHPSIELTDVHRARIRASGTAAAQFLLGVVDFVERRGFKSYCGLIDALAVAAVLDPSLFEVEKVRVAIETSSALTLGQTVVDRREHFRWDHLPQIAAACNVNAPGFLDLLVDSLCSTRPDSL